MTPDATGALGSARHGRNQRRRRARHGPPRVCEVVAIASRTAGARRDEAERSEIPRAYGSYAELLADPEIDAVYVPLPELPAPASGSWPPSLRASTCCARSRWPSPPRDAQKMVDAARAADVVLAEAFMYGHHPRYDRLHEIVAAGEIGDVRAITGTFTFDASDEVEADRVRRSSRWRRRLRRRLLRGACRPSPARHRAGRP